MTRSSPAFARAAESVALRYLESRSAMSISRLPHESAAATGATAVKLEGSRKIVACFFFLQPTPNHDKTPKTSQQICDFEEPFPVH